MRNIDNNSIDETLNHSVSIVWFICYTEGQIARCETMRYRCLLSQMRRHNVNVIFLGNASALYVLKNKVQRYYLTSNFITYYDYNLRKIVLVTKAIQ